jgi:hypothetical protein
MNVTLNTNELNTTLQVMRSKVKKGLGLSKNGPQNVLSGTLSPIMESP